MCWNLHGVRSASILALLALTTAAKPAAAQDDSPPAATVDQLPKRLILSLGQVSPGREAKIAIELRNDLGKQLSIQSVSTDCGCLRVDHDQQVVDDGGTVILNVALAPAKKVGRIRRNLRVFFEQEPSSPLDIGLDTLVIGPIEFRSESVSIQSAGAIEIAGSKSSSDLQILQCEPTRGSCRVLGIEQSPDTFSIRVLPLISFGNTHELFRFRYQEAAGSDPITVDLPLELRCDSKLRFFPSVATIQYEEGAWRSSAKLILAPGSDLDLKQLQLSIERGDGSQWASSNYRVDLLQTSAVLYALQIRCSAPHRDSDRPTRLKVASPNGELLATLDFSSP